MNVYITKLNGAGGTLQFLQYMTAEIGHQLGFSEMGIYRYNANDEKPEERSVRFDGIIAGIQAGDIVICQFHTWNGLRFERALVEHIRAYHGRIVIFIHSLEALMIRGSRFMLGETVELYNRAEALIVPSQKMKRFLRDSGIRAGMKFIVQEMWDWMTGISFRETPRFLSEVRYTGGADAPFAKNWNYDIPLKLCTTSGPDEMLMELSKGGFGLEWYHDDQAYEYMRYGNSFGLSRYLAAGIPVIVPAGISCQKLIEENHLGMVVHSIDEAVENMKTMDESEYEEYVQHVGQFAPALRNGYYTKKCLIASVQALFRADIGKTYIQGESIFELGTYKFLGMALKKTYGGNMALSWNLNGKPDGFLVYDSCGRLIDETENSYQHYFSIRGEENTEFVIKAYVNTWKGKMIVAKSGAICPDNKQYKKNSVSVVIPVYNAESHISRCIDTVLAQSFSDLEIIIVDDGSTDHSSEILDWYAKNYLNITVIHQENTGVQMARNNGIMHANGEYIGFVDSDDMIRFDMIERLYSSVKANQCDIAIASAYEIDSRGYTPIMQYSIKEDTAITAEEFLQIHALGGYAMPAVWNKLYRASLVKKHLFPLVKFEDEAWTPYILSYAKNICYLDGCFYEYDRSICSGSLVDQWAVNSEEEVFQDHKRSILFYLEQGNPERSEILKKLAKSELHSFAKASKYDKYERFMKQIVGEE